MVKQINIFKYMKEIKSGAYSCPVRAEGSPATLPIPRCSGSWSGRAGGTWWTGGG